MGRTKKHLQAIAAAKSARFDPKAETKAVVLLRLETPVMINESRMEMCAEIAFPAILPGFGSQGIQELREQGTHEANDFAWSRQVKALNHWMPKWWGCAGKALWQAAGPRCLLSAWAAEDRIFETHARAAGGKMLPLLLSLAPVGGASSLKEKKHEALFWSFASEEAAESGAHDFLAQMMKILSGFPPDGAKPLPDVVHRLFGCSGKIHWAADFGAGAEHDFMGSSRVKNLWDGISGQAESAFERCDLEKALEENQEQSAQPKKKRRL